MAGIKQITKPAHVKFKISKIERLGRNANIVCKANDKLIASIKEKIENANLEIGIVDRKKKTSKSNPYSNIGINADR